MLLEFHLPTPQCNPQSTQVMVAHVEPTPRTATRCPPYAHMPPLGHCSAPLHLALLVLSTEYVESLLPGEKCVSASPLASSLHDWMVKGDPDPFISVLCTSWIFYRDTDKRNDDGNISYRPFLFARVSSADQEPFIMRMTGSAMTAEWFKGAKAHMDSPSLGRSVHHVKGHR